MFEQRRYVHPFDVAQGAASISALEEWLRAQGVTFTVPQRTHDLLKSFQQKSEGNEVRNELFEMSLMMQADKALQAAGDARRLFRDRNSEPPNRHWYLLTPDEAKQARAQGLELAPARAAANKAAWMLASIPVVLGVYVGADRLLRANGMDATYSWLIALGVYVVIRLGINAMLKGR
ncbi:MAG: hypothetical protein U0228_19920 [Myxococcaceae bacterium]